MPAKRYLSEVEARVARGLVGIPEVDDAPLADDLSETWMARLHANVNLLV